jgi:hypothetical protein
VRYLLRRQAWNPFNDEPVEFVELNFDFHPATVQRELNRAGFEVSQRIPVSFFRMNVFKRVIPVDLLVQADNLLQHSGLLYSPSIFVQSTSKGGTASIIDTDDIFLCPESGSTLMRQGDELVSEATGTRWAIRDGIYDFKAPLE